MSSLFKLGTLVGVLIFVLLASGPAGAQQPVPDDTQPITVQRGSTSIQTRILKETPDADQGRPAREGSLIVKFRRSSSSQERSDSLRGPNILRSESLLLENAVRIQVPPGLEAQVLAIFRRLPFVESAEPDLIARPVLSVNDPNYSQQWGLAKINMPAAWDTTTGSTAVRVAVLDCGIYEPGSSTYVAPDGQVGHPDLRNNKVISRVNFSTSGNSDDYCNHGTHVTGIAAANTGNGVGVAGVGYNTKVVNVKVLGDNGSGSATAIINGVLWAAGCNTNPCGPRQAEIINLSLGAAGLCSSSMQSAIDQAWAQGLIIVAAAGNSNSSSGFWPANCNNVIAVSASTQTDERASFSNYGSWVDVAAPGAGILSSDYVGGYASFNGTSMASPHVAGLAALVWNTPHNTGNMAIANRIMNTATAGALAGSVNGRIDAASAVGVPAPDLTAPTVVAVSSTAADGAYGPGATLPITVQFSEPVQVSGTPQLSLETGAVDAVAAYASGSGTNTLSFSYTIASGHSSPDLDYVSTTALALNSGVIADASANPADLTLPAPGTPGSLGANKALVIDTTAPAPPAFTGTAPASGANDNNPEILGAAEAGSTVRLFAGASCALPEAASGSAAVFGSPGITVSVGDNTTTVFSATATDSAGNASACSASTISYQEISPIVPSGNTGWLSCAQNAAVTSTNNGDRNGFESNGGGACTDGSTVAQDQNSGTSTTASCTSSGKDRHVFYDYNVPALPAGAAVKGIEVRLDARVDSNFGTRQMCVQLSWNGGVSWTAAKTSATLGTSELSYVLGSATDTWGRTWTEPELANANLRVRVTNVGSSSFRDFYLDWIAVRVSYGP